MDEDIAQSVNFRHPLTVKTSGRGFFEITAELQSAVEKSGVSVGLCHCFIHHTSASLVITENADPKVLRDMETFIGRLAPDGDRDFVHTAEGPDDMPAHARSAVTLTSLTLPVSAGRCDLGTWQGVFVWEHRHAPHTRNLTLTVSGSR